MAARYPSEQMLRMVGIGGYSSLGPGVSMANLNHVPPHLYTHVSQPNFIYPPRDGQYPPRWSPRETPEYPVQSSMDSRAPDPYSPVAVPYFRFNREVQREINRELADHLATAMSGVSHHQAPSSQGARRRPSLLPPPTVDYPYPPGVYSRLDGQDRYVHLIGYFDLKCECHHPLTHDYSIFVAGIHRMRIRLSLHSIEIKWPHSSSRQLWPLNFNVDLIH